MATTEMRARAVIEAVDRTQGVFEKIGDRLKRMDRATEAMARADRMKSVTEGFRRAADAADQLGAKASRIESFRNAMAGFSSARSAFREAEANVRSLARQIEASADAPRKLVREYETAQRAVQNASAAFREKTESVKAAKAGLAEYGITLQNIGKEEAKLSESIRRRRPGVVDFPTLPPVQPDRPGGGAHGPAAPAAPGGPPNWVYQIPLIGGAVKATIDALLAGVNVDSEKSRMRQAGWTDKEVETAQQQGNRFAAEYGVSPASSMGIIREARPVFGGDMEQTLASVPDFFAVRTAMQQGNPRASSEELDRAMGQVIKAAEIGGYSKDPAQLKQFTDFMTKMAQVHGSVLRADEIVNLFKSGKTATSGVEFEFLKSIMPTLLPEQTGDRLGTALMTLRQALVGGKMKHLAARNLAELGLIDESKIERDEVGDVKGVKRGGLKGQELVEKNPLEWVKQYLLPALDRAGVKPEERDAKISSLFSDRNAEYVVSLMMNNIERLEKDRAVVEKAKGIEGAKEALRDDPKLAAERAKASLQNAGAAGTGWLMDPLKVSLDKFSSATNVFANMFRGEPINTGLYASSVDSVSASLLEQSRRRQRYVQQYPEAARGEAFNRIGDASKVQVTGEATIRNETKVTVEPSPLFTTTVRDIARQEIQKMPLRQTTNGAGSTGMSSPDAQ